MFLNPNSILVPVTALVFNDRYLDILLHGIFEQSLFFGILTY